MGVLFNTILKELESNKFINQLSIFSEETKQPVKRELYGYRKKINDPNPATRIEYLEDNKDYKSCFMDYTSDNFNYGDWSEAWFIKNIKPVVLNYDGTVAYELNPNDYTKKLDGSDARINNVTINGNVMIGIPTVYVKRYEDKEYQYCYFCNEKINDTWFAWSHINSDGNIIPYCYMPAYNGYVIDNRLRSISGQSITGGLTASVEINAAIANNVSGDTIWYTEVYSDRALINSLLTLIGKSTNTQETFGHGNISDFNVFPSGTMNQKGLFHGSKSNTGVKIFGIENWWGNIYRRIAGHITLNNIQKVKLTHGTQDGSGINGYNIDGTGYIEIPNSSCSGANGGYIKRTLVNQYGEFPIQTGATQDTYECDGLLYTSTGGPYYAIVVSYSDDGHGWLVGAGCWALNNEAANYSWRIGASLSCKPKLL